MNGFERLERAGKIAIEELRARGADTALVSVTNSVKTEFNIENGEFTLMRTTDNDAVTLKMITDGKKGELVINSLNDEALKQAAEGTAKAAQGAEPDEAWVFAENPGEEKFFSQGDIVPDTERLFERTEELLNEIKNGYPLIKRPTIVAEHTGTRSVLMGSDGLLYRRESGAYVLDISFLAEEGDEVSSYSGDKAVIVSLDRPFMELSELRNALDDCSLQVHTEALSGSFEGPMLLTPTCVEEFLQYLIENYCSDFSVLQNTSPWLGKLGEQVADERLCVSMSPNSDFAAASSPYDGQGYISENFDVIKDGVFSGFCIGDYVARKRGMKRAGNQSGNMCIAEGKESLEALISGIDRGILVGRFSGGAPSSNGDFSGVAKNSFLIEGGKRTVALREVMINGNLSAIFNNIRGISSERKCNGMSIRPYIAFNDVVISGK